METHHDLSTGQLADEITTLAGRLRAARQLPLIDEFDRRWPRDHRRRA